MTDQVSIRNTLRTKLLELFPDMSLYFNPTSLIELNYPCIVYRVSDRPKSTANNRTFKVSTEFELTFMSPAPGIDYTANVLEIPEAEYVRGYMSSDIMHEIYRVTIL